MSGERADRRKEPGRDLQAVLLEMIQQTEATIRDQQIRLGALREALRVVESLR